MIYNFLFPSKPNSTGASLFLLALRIFFGLLLMNHGIQKWSSYQELSIVCMQHGFTDSGYYLLLVEANDTPVPFNNCLYHDVD